MLLNEQQQVLALLKIECNTNEILNCINAFPFLVIRTVFHIKLTQACYHLKNQE